MNKNLAAATQVLVESEGPIEKAIRLDPSTLSGLIVKIEALVQAIKFIIEFLNTLDIKVSDVNDNLTNKRRE